jgi:hypothetical protein
MKRKVVLEGNENEVHIDQIYDDCIIAAYIEGDGHVMVLTTIDDSYRSVWLYTDQMQNYNYVNRDLKEVVTEMIDDGLEVLQFSDEAEFGEWLMEILGPDNGPKIADVKPSNFDQTKSPEYYNSRP